LPQALWDCHCSRRGLHLRRDAAQRPDHLALRGVGHVFQLRDRQDFDIAEDDAKLMAQSAARRRRHATDLMLGNLMARETSYFV
jgi:hypothetical protein